LTFALDTSTSRKENCCFRLKDLENKDVEKKLRQQKKLIRQIQNMKCLCGLHEGQSEKDSEEDRHVKFLFQAEEVLRGNVGLKRGD